MPEDTQPQSNIEELTAYLDGELDATEVERVEKRLGTDAEYRAEMQTLQQTWELFERMPAEEKNDAFVQTTMEMLVEDVERFARKKRFNGQQLSRALFFVVIPCLLFTGGLLATQFVLQTPHRQLIGNLPLIENLDRYEKIRNDIGFLEQLDQLGLFAENTAYVAANPDTLSDDLLAYSNPVRSTSRDTIESRRARIDSLDFEQQRALQRNYKAFSNLSQTQKQQLREFHNALMDHPEGSRLNQVLLDYYEWLKTLGLTEQAALLDLPAEQQLREIWQIKLRQAREAFGKSGATRLPTAQDAEFLFDWYELTLNTRENEIRDRFLQVVMDYLQLNDRSVPSDRLNLFAQRQSLNLLLAILMRIDPQSVQDLLFTEVELLRRGLSPSALAIFDQQTVAGQQQLLLNWIDSANQSKMTISPERLQEFYEGLSLVERDELDKLSPDNWIRELTAKYWQQHQPRQPQAQSPFGFPTEWQTFLDDDYPLEN